MIELLCWGTSSCAAARFQHIARRLFLHQAHTHHLITRRDRARRTPFAGGNSPTAGPIRSTTSRSAGCSRSVPEKTTKERSLRMLRRSLLLQVATILSLMIPTCVAIAAPSSAQSKSFRGRRIKPSIGRNSDCHRTADRRGEFPGLASPVASYNSRGRRSLTAMVPNFASN